MKLTGLSLIALPALLAISGCVHDPARPDAASHSVNDRAATVTERVLVPGSRVLRHVDPDDPNARHGASPTRIYQRSELVATGETDTAAALKKLDPALHGVN